MKLMKAVYVLGIIGIVAGLLSAVLFVSQCEWNNAVGMFSTIISIVLGVASIVYTYQSGKETLNLLDDIRAENKGLVKKINDELSKNNYDEENLESLRRL